MEQISALMLLIRDFGQSLRSLFQRPIVVGVTRGAIRFRTANVIRRRMVAFDTRFASGGKRLGVPAGIMERSINVRREDIRRVGAAQRLGMALNAAHVAVGVVIEVAVDEPPAGLRRDAGG